MSEGDHPEPTPVKEIWRRFKETGDDGLRSQLVERYRPVLRYIAERICATLPKSVDVDDLESEGLFGLYDAIEKFDPERGFKFKTYCSQRIRGAILDALRHGDWVPRLVRQKATRLEKVRADLLARYGREPTHAEWADALGVDEKEVAQALGSGTPRAIHHMSDRSDTTTAVTPDQVGTSREESPLEAANRRDLMDAVLSRLSEKERQIVRMYYEEHLTMRQIGERLSLTESRICQLHSNIMKRLRKVLADSKDQLLP